MKEWENILAVPKVNKGIDKKRAVIPVEKWAKTIK